MSVVILALCLVGSLAYNVVVLGDIHGDYDAMIAILKNNGVLDNGGNWLDETTKVVSVGDLIGRGHQDDRVLEFIHRAMDEHKWFQLLGNHEIMQLHGDWRYAVDGQGIGFGSLEARKAALREGSPLSNWLRSVPAILQEGDNLFIHAGMSNPQNVGRSMTDLNTELAAYLVHRQPRVVYDDLIWARTLVQNAYQNVPGTCEHLESVLKTFGAKRLFIGHTPVQSLIGSNPRPVAPMAFCDGRLRDVDVGISRWMYSNPVNLKLELDDDTGETVEITTVYTNPIGGAPSEDVTSLAEVDDTATALDVASAAEADQPGAPSGASAAHWQTATLATIGAVCAALVVAAVLLVAFRRRRRHGYQDMVE